MSVSVLDIILGVCLFAAIIGVVFITYTNHDVAAILSITTALLAFLTGKKVDAKA